MSKNNHSGTDSSKSKKVVLFTLLGILIAILLYLLVCCGITFVPMIKMLVVNKTACGELSRFPDSVVELEGGANLYVYLNEGKRDKYVVICPGGGYVDLSMSAEGFCVAEEFNKMGYTAFVLGYHVGKEITDYQQPLDDLAEAIVHIDTNADEYNVYKGLYVLCGFSAGGNLVGMFGTQEFGYPNYDSVKKPNAIVMGYPWVNPEAEFSVNLVETIYEYTIVDRGAKAFLIGDANVDQMQVQHWVTADYPRTFIMHGDSDSVISAETQSEVLCQAFDEYGVEYVYKKCEGVNHGCGIALGTSAEGWLEEAMDFVDEKWYEDEFEPYYRTSIASVKEKAGGFLTGVCHPNDKLDEVVELGADWVRVDLSVPVFDADGNEVYYDFGNGQVYYMYRDYYRPMFEQYKKAGLKVFAVTPYPREFLAWGIDPREEKGKIAVMKNIRFFAEDLGDIVAAWQITNEMTEPQFRAPLTAEEAADYIGLVARAIYRYRGDAIIGYNLSATEFATFLPLMNKYNKYFDYIGIDLYLGCFESMTYSFGFATAKAWILSVQVATNHMPIIFTEFGYLSAGERKTTEEKLAILHRYGAVGDTVEEAEAYAKAHIRDFIENEYFPERLRERLETISATDEEIADNLFGTPGMPTDYSGHLYSELGEGILLKGYPHTPEGQAKYFTDFIDNVILEEEDVCGAFLYCFCDSPYCYVCGQSDCPVETGWGLLDGEGNKKPSFYSIQEAFAKCKEVK